MLDPTALFIGVAAAALVLPGAFLVIFAIAVNRRSHGKPVGNATTLAMAFLGGLCVGVFYLLSTEPLAQLAVGGAGILLVLGRWQIGRRVQAGLLLLGGALPWTLLWGFYVGAMELGGQPFDPGSTWIGLIAGLVPAIVGGLIVRAGDPTARAA